VLARTGEVGARGKQAGWRWSAAVYRTLSDNDIQFISAGNAINAGYFRNVGSTRRQGVELMLGGPVGPIEFVVRYSFIDARYVDGFIEHSPNNSTADANGDIAVAPGSRIPASPRQTLRLRVDGDAAPGWRLGANLLLNDATFARGDENNRAVGGRVGGYAVLNLDTTWQLASHVELFARVNNVFDRRYANFGILGANVFANPGRTFDPANARSETFVGQGAPRGAWAGVRVSWP